MQTQMSELELSKQIAHYFLKINYVKYDYSKKCNSKMSLNNLIHNFCFLLIAYSFSTFKYSHIPFTIF